MSNIKEKGGRPPLAESQKKDYVVKLCFDKGQYNLIDYKAKKAGISKAEFCREAALDTKITQVLTPEQLDIIRKLSGMANNLNQIARHFNTEGVNSRTVEELEQFLAEIHKHKRV